MASATSFRSRVLVVVFVLTVLYMAGRAAHVDGPNAVMAMAALLYAVAEVVRKLTGE